MKFSENGPDFPDALLKDFLAGEVVLLCGAGVSAASGLPDFKCLTDLIFEHLGEEKSPAESFAYKDSRYEESLGALASRVANPSDIIDSIEELFSHRNNGNLKNHESLLRLSRDNHNRITLLTTNFDTVFERAAKQEGLTASGISFSGQDMPLPGASDFQGIIHLHGRLSDAELDLSRTPLVLTSSDYGEAYLRAGWASRFLFDLVRCRTLLLVGYSAGDATVRYILNVLHADRDRFPEVRDVYAMVPSHEPEARWEAISVEPIVYKNETNDHHDVLWTSLGQLVSYVETPDDWRAEVLKTNLAKRYASLAEYEINQCLDALRMDAGLWDKASTYIKDPAWIEHLTSGKEWPSDETRSYLLAQWASMNWQNREVYETVLQRVPVISRKFTDRLEVLLEREPPQSLVWSKAWRLLSHHVRQPAFDGYLNYRTTERLKWNPALDIDLIEAVRSITPRLDIRPLSEFTRTDLPDDSTIEKIADICHFRVKLDLQGDGSYPVEFLNLIQSYPSCTPRVIETASEALNSALILAADVEQIGEGYDNTLWSVPSVDDHKQNKYHEDYLYLVRLLADSFNEVVKSDPEIAKYVVSIWKEKDFSLFKRLSLFALKSDIFTAQEAFEYILTLEKEDLSNCKRELMLLLKARSNEASVSMREEIIAKILSETPLLYPDKESDKTDGFDEEWRPRARDRMAWRLLKSMSDGGALETQSYLDELTKLHQFLMGEIEDSDYFDYYLGGTHRVEGDASELTEATPEQRIDLIQSYAEAPHFSVSENWPRYCRQDPKGALETLIAGGERSELSKPWSDLMWSLSRPEPADDQEKSSVAYSIAIQAFEHLKTFSDTFLDSVGYALVWGFGFAQSMPKDDHRYWWDRLCASASRSEYRESDDLLTSAINSSGGRLTEMLLIAINSDKKTRDIKQEDYKRLFDILGLNTFSGLMARTIAVRSIGFINSISPSFVDQLKPYIILDTPEGKGLRQVLLTSTASLSADLTKSLTEALIMGASEIPDTHPHSYNAAAKYILPILNQLRDPKADWGITSQTVRNALKQSPVLIRAAANVLSNWLVSEEDASKPWLNIYKTAFLGIWPKDKKFRDSRVGFYLAKTAVAAREEFPNALKTLRPYISPVSERWSENIFSEKHEYDVCTHAPSEALDLLYLLYSKVENRSIYKLSKPLDRIVSADARFAKDRRIQTLRRKSM